MISWKNSFKRLNEEYELAKKKKQAVDNLYITGKISQFTRDSFIKDISATIVDIERQQKDLVEKMQIKTDELSCQIKTLESLLANYEIQHVIGEIDEDAYQRDILLLTAGIDAAKNELETIKQATLQLCAPVPTIQAPTPAELHTPAPTFETPVMECAPTQETTPVEFSLPIEAPVESTPIETPIFEANAAPITETLIEEQTFAAEAPVFDEPVMESAPLEELSAVIDEPVVEAAIPVTEAPVFDEPVMESALFEETPAAVEESIMESPIFEEALFVEETEQISSADINDVVAESTIDMASTESVFLDDAAIIEEPVLDYASVAVEETLIESAPIIETPLENTVAEIDTEDIVADVPLQVFEVTEQAPVEQTLEKVMEQLSSPVVEALTVEELTHDSHPSIAPHQAPSEIITEAVSDGQIDESGEDTTE
ncbi:MAG: CdvA-like protein [Nitrososphaerota archaeon]|nr:CdvA-like protein [Nitrososphaerota archaeon]